jgi:hypothetical protein
MRGKTAAKPAPALKDVKPCAAEIAVFGLKPPEPEAEAGMPSRPPLLRWPPGEAPIYRGIVHAH